MKRATALCIMGLTACGGASESGEEEVSDSARTVEIETLPADVPLPPMPPFPISRPGHLVALGAGGRDTLDGAWRARGASCEDPPVLQIVAETEEIGTLLVYHLVGGPLDGASYRVALADSGLPAPPGAALGVQVTTERGVFAYQAVHGIAELDELNVKATGRFAVTLREVDSQDSLRYVGAFADVPVSPGLPAECAAIRDSLLPATTGAQPDSVATRGSLNRAVEPR